MLDAAGLQLRATLLELFKTTIDEPLDDAAFNTRALDIFRYQFERNAPFAAYCTRRGRTPDKVTHWTALPAVPTAAFREVTLVSGDAATAEAVFRTSGTTHGAERRGTHPILDLTLYHASVLAHFAARVLPDGIAPIMLSLVPPASDLPDSSLAHMIQVVLERLGAEGSQHLATAATGIDTPRLTAALRRCEDENLPVCLLGTSFSFVHWTDHMRGAGLAFSLPARSRLMDTGGYKGRTRDVPEGELRETYAELLGLDPDFCINEYGMTELCSQFYDDSLATRTATGASTPRRKVGPPWTRTRVVDPDSLAPLPDGSTGLLQHIDLANLGSVLVVQTEDLGSLTNGGFHLVGRAAGAQPRGCSIAMDELLLAARHTR